MPRAHFLADQREIEHEYFASENRLARCEVCGLIRRYCREAQNLPAASRGANQQTIMERARFIAHEIFEDRLAPEHEIIAAIASEIRRFLR